MGIASSDNVVSLRDFAQQSGMQAVGRARVTPDTVGVINDCRDLALKRICEVLANAFDRIEDELFEMAEKTTDRDTQNMYLDARAQAREKRSGIEASFRQQYVSFFNGKVRGEPEKSTREAKPALSFSELSLVDDNDLEESIALTEMAKKMRAQSEEELFALSQRMGFLMHDPELADDANPMSPDTLCKALNEACSQITAGYRIKLTIMKLFEQHVARDLVGVYKDINSHLVQRHQILPDVRPTYRTASTPSRKPAATVAPAAAPGGAPSQDAGTGGDLFATLQQLMTQNTKGGGGMPQGLGAAILSGSPGMGGMSPMMGGMVAPAQQALFSKLTEIQHGALAGIEIPKTIPAGMDVAQALNVLHQISTQGLTGGASQVDAMTIDIVAMLFDYVFGDRHIPDAIKALLARLQIPVLKVALLDKQFFSQKTHPARVLLDKLAELALECEDSVSAEDAVYQRIETVVDTIRDGFESDIDVFVQQLAALEAFMAEHTQAGTDFVERSARLVHDRERREIARLVAESAVRERVQGKTLPSPVVVMLKVRWVDVLKLAYLQGGEDSAAWSTACQTVDELLWSLEPKMRPEDRKSLVALLPKLLKRLQEGMHAVDVEQVERERFFATLVDCHAIAVKAGLRQEQTPQTPPEAWVAAESVEVPPQPAPSGSEESGGFMRIHLESQGVRVEEIRLNNDTPAAQQTPRVRAAAKLPDELQRGTWVEFVRAEGKKLRAKLTWISPQKGMLLFTNPQSSGAVSVTQEALAAQLQDGTARIVAEAPLVERAVHSVLDNLRAA